VARPTVLLCAVAFAFGCSGTIDEGQQVAGLTPAQQLALNAWLQLAQPSFVAATCVMCHDPDDPTYDPTMAAGAPPYLEGSSQVDQRDTVIATMPAVVDLNSPRTSMVLTKGLHEGPALDAVSATNILTWITYERDARLGSNLPTTAPYTMMDCTGGSAGSTTCPINSIDTTPAGAAGKITFTETPLTNDQGQEDDIDVEGLTITAGASGLHVVHPLFGTIPAAGSGSGSGTTYDPLDRFSSIDMELAPNATLMLGGQTFVNFVHTDPIVVQFDVLTGSD
jgi:mono/diheme cytochrome c family protein